MKKGLKADILETARRMFNEQGYSGVSMRDIAGELGISVGNLTYHFKRKEDILEAVVEERHRGYRRAEPAGTMAELDAFFRRKLEFQRGNAYYFRHYGQLAHISPKMYEMHCEVIRDMCDFFCETFRRFQARGTMRPDELPGQSRHLAQSLTALFAFGMGLWEEDRLSCFWSLIYPVLTQQGKREYQEM